MGMQLYEKNGRRFRMTAQHAERVGATLVDGAKAAPAAKNKAADAAANKSAAKAASKAELVAQAEALGLDTSGTKAELADRIAAAGIPASDADAAAAADSAEGDEGDEG